MARKLLFAAALALGISGSAHADFANAGFESGLTGWSASGDVAVVSSFTFGSQTIVAPEGSKMALLGNAELNFNVLLQSLEASSQPMTLWYRFLGTGGGGVGLDVQHATLTSPSPVNIGSYSFSGGTFDTGWKQFAMAAGTTFVGFFHDTISGNSSVLVDVAPVPEPGTTVMLLAGLGLMGTVIRRRSRSGRA